MASVANKIRRSRESRARVKAANRKRLELVRKGEIVLAPRHGKVVRRPRVTMAQVLAKWTRKILFGNRKEK